MQPVRLPGLQSFQSFLNPLLQLQPVTIQRPNGFAVLSFGVRCFPPASNEWGLCVRTPGLAHDVDQCTRGLREFRSNTLQGRGRNRGLCSSLSRLGLTKRESLTNTMSARVPQFRKNIEYLWPELVEGIAGVFKLVAKLANPPQQVFTFCEFPSGHNDNLKVLL